jgi:hypothetical protein
MIPVIVYSYESNREVTATSSASSPSSSNDPGGGSMLRGLRFFRHPWGAGQRGLELKLASTP